jgi:DNA-directed RNA polymerase specialized sigma24 family protein
MAELIDVLDAKLSRLSPILRSAFHLRDIEHLSTREAANIANVKMSAMKSRTMRARNQVTNTNLLYDWDVNLPVARF